MDANRPSSFVDAPSFLEMADALGLGMAYQVVTDPDGTTRRFVAVSRLCRELTGLTPQEAMDDPVRLYGQILPEHRDALARAEAAAIATLSRFEIEVRMEAPGGVRWRRIASTPRPQPDGSVVWDGLLSDVTATRQAAERLAEQQRRLEAAVEATGLGLWEWDVRSSRVVWSERNRELFGVADPEPMTIQRYLELVHPEDRAALQQVYRATAEAPAGGDFVAEHRTAFAPEGKVRWVQARGRIVKDAAGVRLVVGTTLDITERKLAEERRTLLMGELAHRAKNGIQIMMGIVAQTARGATSVSDFEAVLMARLKAMADSQDLVTASGGRPVALKDVVATSLNPFDLSRFDVEVDEAVIGGDVAVGLALLLHELSTNAVKYGALSASEGRVVLRHASEGDGRALLHWQEHGGPTPEPSPRKGFGTRLLEVSLKPQGGGVEPAFEPGGFTARIVFPLAQPNA